MRVDKGSEFDDISLNVQLQDINIEIYATHYEEKCVVAERFITTLKNKTYKYITSLLKTVYNDNSTDIVNEYKNAYHRTLKRKSTDVKGSIYFDFGSENNEKIPKFEVGENVRISKYKEIFTKGYTPNCCKEDIVIKEVKDTLQWNM